MKPVAQGAKTVVVLVLVGFMLLFYFLAREQLGLLEWQHQWRSHYQLPATPLPWQDGDPNALELQVAQAIAHTAIGQNGLSATQDVENILQKLQSLRPGWPYYQLLAQQWKMAQGRWQPESWLQVLRDGVHEPSVSQAVARVLFQNWAMFSDSQRQEMLDLLWHSGSRNQSRLINDAFLSSRLFEYCDYGYNTALDVPPDCLKAGWRPLEKSPESATGAAEAK